MKKYSSETMVGVFVVVGLLCIGYMTVKLGNVGILGDHAYVLKARFNKVTGLRVGNAVSMLGLEIGQVSGFSIDQEEQVAIVEMKIRNDIKIYHDAIAAIKTSGLIGDRYINIDAGGSEDVMEPGTTIRDTVPPVDIEELISKFVFGGIK